MSWTGFDSLDLTNVEEQKSRLEEGRYIAVCREAKVAMQDGSSNRRVEVRLEDEAGAGDIINGFNVYHTNEQAMEIGLRQMKSFLVCAGHPNPNKPGDISSLKGLRVGIIVGMGKPYTDNKGVERQRTEVKAFFDPNKSAGPTGPAPKSAGPTGPAAKRAAGALNDEIPFAPEFR